jgi:hypothetical protein
MVIAVFPVAIEQNKNSTADTLGTIICENGLAAAKAAWSHPLAPLGVTNRFDPALIDTPGLALDGNYPTGVSGANRGFFALARQPDPTRNDYQFLVVSYLKSKPGNNVRPYPANLTVSWQSNVAVIYLAKNAAPWLKVGSPVIDPSTGLYATIQKVVKGGVDNTVTLDRPLSTDTPVTTIPGGQPVIVVAETDSANNPDPTIILSPVTRVMNARASLRQ